MPCQSPLTQKTALKKADILVLQADSPDLDFQSRSRAEELTSLTEYILEFYERCQFYPVIVCDALGCAQEIINHLSDSDIKVAVSHQIYQFSKLYREAQIDLGSHWSRYHRKYFRQKVLIVSLQSLGRLKLTSSFRRSMVYVTGYLSSYRLHKDHACFERLFFLNHQSGLKDIEATLEAVEPRRVVLTGRFISQYMEKLRLWAGARAEGLELVVSYPNQQPTLADLACDPSS